MTEVAWLPREELTVEDLALLPDDGHRYEIVDGSLIVSPPPSLRHQFIAARLTELLRGHASGDVVVLEGAGVRAGLGLLIPDVTVGRADVAIKEQPGFQPWDMQLVVEIESRSSVTMDRVTKPSLYAAGRIPSYWRIERDHPDGVLLAIHELDGDSYRLVDEVIGDAEAVVERPFPLRFRPADLLVPR